MSGPGEEAASQGGPDVADPDVPIADGGAVIKRPVVMPEVFTGEEEWEEWLSAFEACAEVNGWDDPTKCKFMLVRFHGQARKVIHDLDQATKTNWNQLKSELERRFGRCTRPDLFKSEFLAKRKSTSETYLELGNSLRSLARKAYPTIPNNVRDELAKDQFLRIIQNPEMAIKVRQANPKTLDEAIRMTVEYKAVEKDVKGTKVGSEVNAIHTTEKKSESENTELVGLMREMMTFMKEEREFRKDMLSSTRGARGSWGPGRGRGRGRDKSEVKCYSCGVKGHYKSECPKQDACFECGQHGHFARKCPNKSENW